MSMSFISGPLSSCLCLTLRAYLLSVLLGLYFPIIPPAFALLSFFGFDHNTKRWKNPHPQIHITHTYQLL